MKKAVLSLLLVMLIISTAFGQTIKHGMQDTDREGFEDGLPSNLILVGYPSGDPPASVEITGRAGEYKSGGRALSFSYDRGKKPVPILLHRVLLQDFETIDFWIKAEKPALWVVNISDLDGAEFSSSRKIPAGRWTRVTLAPGDFSCNEDSSVKKESLDTKRLEAGFACFDLFSVIGGEGKNQVIIDDVTVKRPPVTVIEGDYILASEKQTISRRTRIEGDLVLTKGSELLVTAERFRVDGDVIVKRSKLTLSGGGWTLNQDYRYQRNMWAKDGGRIEMEKGLLYLVYPYGAAASGGGDVSLKDVRVVSGLFTFGLQKGSSLRLEGCERFGEVILYKGGSLYCGDSASVLLWLNLESGASADVSFSKAEQIGRFTLPPQIGRKVLIERCREVIWGIIAESGSALTVRDSDLRAFGIHFLGKSMEVVRGFKNGQHYSDFSYSSEGHNLRFIDTKVDTWNFYASGRAQLEIRDCIFGEAVSFGRSRISIYDSVCDGTGGYLGAKDDSSTMFIRGEIACDVLTHDRGSITVKDCAGIGGRVEASGMSKIIVINTPVDGPVRGIDGGEVILNKPENLYETERSL